MKKSIFIASFILLVVVGWIGSGQFTNVIAQDDTTSSTDIKTESVEKVIIEDSGNKVEIKEFNFNQIDQSIELQGQTTHNKKIILMVFLYTLGRFLPRKSPRHVRNLKVILAGFRV